MRSPIILVAALLLSLAGCRRAPEVGGQAGDPVAGLSRAELARFHAGQALFNHVFTPAEGVGPLFNENQCSGCHTDPAAGGTGEQRVIKATRFSAQDRCDLLSAEGGENVRKQATPLLAARGIQRQAFPPDATQRSTFIVPFIFGLGLVDAIPASSILKRADPADANGDGISGRPGFDAHGRLARFGRKADVASLQDFVESAAHFEMGLTTPANHLETLPLERTPDVDPHAEPELSSEQVKLLTDFVRFLAPPARRTNEFVTRGQQLFYLAHCQECHTPAMTTKSPGIPALDHKRVYLYSDLLLHDLGRALSGVCAATATPTEWRTASLMGLRLRDYYMHDGRARDLFDAIRLHGGEADAARRRFERLNPLQQDSLIQFLRTL